ncbi:54S ribosomal protein L39, mitochondrial [Thoreauomyces humboldtii]|nr:54S ribosomal protein L39, mitochondrial [Thoreauomyces humboldtii]
MTQHKLDVWNTHADALRRDLPVGGKITVRVEGRTGTVEGQAGVLSPLDVIRELDVEGSDQHLLAMIDKAHPWDLSRPLQESCSLDLIPTDSSATIAQHTVWHSAAHILGWAMEKKFGDAAYLCDGPALKTGGFFYDALIRNAPAPGTLLLDASLESRISHLLQSDASLRSITLQDTRELASHMKSFAKKKARFQRLVVPRSVAQNMFRDNPFKLYFLSRVPPDAPVTLYRCGDFIDLCRGPHVPHTGYLRHHSLTRTAGAQWEQSTDAAVQPLSRVYGVAFTTQPALEAWEKAQEEAAKRDHRLVGMNQSLFVMHPLAPGSPFMLPHGTRIVQRLLDFLRKEYRRFGFQEVVTPLLFNKDVWVTSGHWENYKDDMFVVHTGSQTEATGGGGGCCGGAHDDSGQADSDVHGLKPMNCPGHCLLFATAAKSYRDLPVRIAEFSPLHRNEASGALTGLTRVRKFHQDDGHIFCTPAQVGPEIAQTLAFIDRVYSIFGFPSYELALSTRPMTGTIGTQEQWDDAERQLRSALDGSGREWTLNEGDGAFYGPKIDIRVRDALGRLHQTATVQLDFNLPRRFDLGYADADNVRQRPVLIHRAVLGSVERMMAVLTEHYAGRWPFWLSPRQAVVVPVGIDHAGYARRVAEELSGRDGGEGRWHVDVDDSDRSLAKRIREAQGLQYNFMMVVGDEEKRTGMVSVRGRDGKDVGSMSVEDVMAMFAKLESDFA